MGTLVSPREPGELAAAMLGMAATPREVLDQLGKNARRRAVGHFRAERMRGDYEALYEECFNFMQHVQVGP
jgi:glycosyltransferase involved in cell wall biosynthesis